MWIHASPVLAAQAHQGCVPTSRLPLAAPQANTAEVGASVNPHGSRTATVARLSAAWPPLSAITFAL